MATLITMPAIVADSTDAVLSLWLRKPGDTVSAGDALAEIETEKASVEMEAEASGILRRLLVEEGSTVAVGAPIAILGGAEETEAELLAVLGEAAAPAAEPTTAAPAAPAPVTTAPLTAVDEPRVFASPLARRLAREHGLSVDALQGSGPGGRIVRSDVLAAASAAPAPVTTAPAPVTVAEAPAPAAAPSSAITELPEGAERVPLSRMRATIARRLSESKSTVPHFYLSRDVTMDALLALRRQINEAASRKVTVNDLVVRAVALALQDVPEANVSWGGDHVVRYRASDVSVAVAIDGGLVTPVLRGAESLSIEALSATLADNAERARDGKLAPAELSGGSFTVSNLGMFGVREFAAIINPPQAGILAVGSAEQRAVVVDGGLTVATRMTVTLSADHRCVDGAVGARFLAAFAQRVENPLSILL
ncbi:MULTISPECIES: dihydrolipoamide acetyltransferase family protein [Arthrobacter]|uniref:Dihydrolipoamide acetyltransferase component of pyruvate dehydrogenase complex n=2 Tax=Arthrobacter TaxID=1663 RepID=A0ABU9KLP3_9MICC|nr:dihydrolipoamide acetyltransferase family protein [Arthrobacter sp. YJM1]MDP5226722.1 dihydrolipoamide acetyltransferase family protein [Arthrobacter sp. YJM1]